jgi:hypothetical protein
MKRIKIDRPELSDKDIFKHKDFNSLSSTFSNPPTNAWTNLKYWAFSGGGLMLVAAIVYFAVGNKDSKPINKVVNELTIAEETKTSIIPPIEEMDVPYETFVIDNTRDTNIHYHTGSIVHIPKHAFKTDKPEQVTINYREFHNPMDIFLSGIPMAYDSAGVEYTFESAGMLDIQAFEANKKLELKEGVELDIQMASLNLEPEFNLYNLDETTGVWDYKGKDRRNPLSRPVAELKNYEEGEFDFSDETYESEDDFSTISRRAPAKRNEKRYAFKIDLDNVQKQKFVNVEDVMFEIRQGEDEGNGQSLFDSKYYDIEWESMDLKAIEDGDYDLKLRRGRKSFDLIVYPVYSDAKYQAAKDAYEKELKANQEQKQKLLANRRAQTTGADNIANMYDAYMKSALSPKGFREFSVSRLGVHNMDLPNLPDGKLITPSLLSQNEEHLKYDVIYVVEKDKNMVSKFTDDIPSIIVDTDKENVIWALTKENKIAIPKQEQVSAITKSSKVRQQFDAEEYQPKEGVQALKRSMDLPVTQKKEKVKLSSKNIPKPLCQSC